MLSVSRDKAHTVAKGITESFIEATDLSYCLVGSPLADVTA